MAHPTFDIGEAPPMYMYLLALWYNQQGWEFNISIIIVWLHQGSKSFGLVTRFSITKCESGFLVDILIEYFFLVQVVGD